MDEIRCSHWLTSWVKPLAVDNFCGEDASFSLEFEALKAEVDKDTSLHATGSTDWVIVLRMATEFLEAQSKDVWALAYGTYALHRVSGLVECAAALATLTDVLQTYWERLYPSPMRTQRRLAPLQWLCNRLEASAELAEFQEESPLAVNAFQLECERLQEFLHLKVGESAPSFTGICKKIPIVHTTPLETEPVSAQSVTSVSSPATSIAAVLTELGADGRIPSGVLPQLVRNILEQARQLAGHFLSLNMLDERAYQLHRAAIWSTLLQLPHSDPSGKTQLSCGVPADKIHTYAAGIEERQYAGILPALERSAAKAPFWLDGHYMVARCLEGLGAAAALGCVRAALSQLLGRFPELLGYTFKDGKPFASSKIIPWLEALSSGAPGNTTPYSELKIVEGGREGITDEIRLQEAIAIFQEQDFRAGLASLGVSPAGRSRSAILHGLLQARYCLATGKRDAATNLSYALYNELEQLDLLDWEPDLTASVLFLLCSAHPKQPGVTEEMIRRLYLCSLDTALTVFKEK